jgi:hypothetical protein
MLDAARKMGRDDGAWVDANFELDSGVWAHLAECSRDDAPVVLLATSFALVQLFDAVSDRPPIQLPKGSRVMDTGGYKGRSRTVTRDELLLDIAQRLGVHADMVENEYGMSELSTQAWLGTIARSTGHPLGNEARWQPWWMRTRVVDPQTLREVNDGECGLLVHHDLANAYSCACIRTEDWGRRIGSSYELLGRAPGAELRGCSLQLEAVL